MDLSKILELCIEYRHFNNALSTASESNQKLTEALIAARQQVLPDYNQLNLSQELQNQLKRVITRLNRRLQHLATDIELFKIQLTELEFQIESYRLQNN